jgi:aspartate-semialdehyde dehydrogenase
MNPTKILNRLEKTKEARMLKIAVIGATGAVGRQMLDDLEQSTIKDVEIGLFASPRSAGESIMFRGKSYTVSAYALEKMKGFKACLMSAGGSFSRANSKMIAELGITVVDNSSAWRMIDSVPLVVPEVNPNVLKDWQSGIIANPNCSTIQMVVPLKALKDSFGIDQVHVSTYQSVSGTGQKGIKELSNQIDAHFKFADPKPEVYAQPIAFNVLPAIDVLDAKGHCFEEEKMVRETRKILEMPSLEILATTVRVPVFSCHSESVAVRTKKAVTRSEALEVLRNMKGLTVHDVNHHAEFPTPRSVAGDSSIHVTRIRTPFDQESSNWLQFWVVADNLRKGAATNAVQILELLGYH